MFIDYVERFVNLIFASMVRPKPYSQQVLNTKLIAHRGAHNNKQRLFENTLESFQLAQDAGCWGIEFDIHATVDGVYVVNHDPTLTRLWGHEGHIAQMTFAQLRALEPGIPSLAEVVQRFGQRLHLFIEIKTPVCHEDDLYSTLQDLEPVKEYHLLALEDEIFTGLKRFPKNSFLLVASHQNSKAFCNLSVQKQYGGVLGSYALLTNKNIQALKNADQAFGVGFVDSKFSLYREMRRGIPWIFTNQSKAVCDALDTLKMNKTHEL